MHHLVQRITSSFRALRFSIGLRPRIVYEHICGILYLVHHHPTFWEKEKERGHPLWRQLTGLLLAAEGAGRRLASLPGLRGILSGGAHPGDDEAQVIGDPKNSFSFFTRRRRRRGGDEKVGAQPQAPGEGRPPFTIPLTLTPKGTPRASSGGKAPAPPLSNKSLDFALANPLAAPAFKRETGAASIFHVLTAQCLCVQSAPSPAPAPRRQPPAHPAYPRAADHAATAYHSSRRRTASMSHPASSTLDRQS
jgi:hypothetical protein